MPLLRVMAGSRSFGALLAAFILAARVHALCAQFIRAEGHTTLYAVQGLLNTALYIAFNVLFLTVFRWGVMGYLLSTVAADCLSALFLICRERLWRQFRPVPSAALWRQMLAYCVPLIPTAAFWWIMGVSDRYLVKWFVGSDANGIYAVAYKIPTILTILATVFMDAWQLSAVTEEDERARFFTKIFRTYSSVLFCCAAGIIWLCRPVMHVMKSNYYYAWHFVPFLVLASTCSCFNQFMNSVYVVTKKSSRSMVTMMAGAISNCIMNYFFIKWWGPIGATYASFLGLALVFTLRSIDANRMIHMHVHPGRVLLNVGLLVFEAFVLLAETPLYGLWTGLITAVVILINFAGVWAMARVLLPRLLGRRGKALVAAVDGWLRK
mgnify:CR=1 FL=1